MVGIPTDTILKNLVSWSAQYSIAGGHTASAVLTNQNNYFDPTNLRWQPITITLTNTVLSDLLDETGLADTVNWITGVITSANEPTDTREAKLNLNIGSYFSTISSKPINTHNYAGLPAAVIYDILTVYFGVPSALLSMSVTSPSYVYLPVSGQDCWAELQKLAEVANCDLFTQVGGILTLSGWKNSTSSVDYVLSSDFIQDIKVDRTREKTPTRFMVKGKWGGLYNCGTSLLTHGGQDKPKMQVSKCYVSGVTEATSKLFLKNISASKADLANASYLVNGDLSQFEVPNDQTDKGTVAFSVSKGDTTVTPANVLQRTDVQLLAKRTDVLDPSKTEHKGKATKAVIKRQDLVLSKLAGLPPGSISTPDNSGDGTSDSGADDRHTIAVNDLGLQSQYGIITETIDNPYIADSWAAISIAIRKFQEIRMQRRRYVLQVAYVAYLRLNQVIQFQKISNPAETVTGRIVELSINYDNAPKVTQTVTVDSFEDIGDNTYTLGNLFVYPECCGINGVDWVADGEAYAVAGYFALASGSGIGQTFPSIIGADYTVACEILAIGAAGSFQIEQYTDGSLTSSSVATSSNGAVVFSFVGAGSLTTVVFRSVSGEWGVTQPLLTLSVLG